MLQLSLVDFSLLLLLPLLLFPPAGAFPIIGSGEASTRKHATLTARQDAASTSTIPSYALQYAPVMYLHSDEQWFPTDVKAFLSNVLPYDTNHLQLSNNPPNLTSLTTFNTIPTYLSSIQDITALSSPSWLNNDIGKPDSTTGQSPAPIEILIAEKENGIVDVFYFLFFAYNKGPEVLGSSFGDHVGDWEHTMIRFQDSQPVSIYLSQHDSGIAYSWNAIIKDGNGRPVIYVSQGDHACYAMPGTHSYATILSDETNAGTLWDITLNYRSYSFDSISGSFSLLSSSNSSNSISDTAQVVNNDEVEETQDGTNWLTWSGYWGDKQLSKTDNRQFCAFGHCKFTDGPLGPYLKNLGRKTVCQNDDDCVINNTL